ncbi:heme utilization cystosolic carrier protein HutX [Grimontia hollisae]|uniref:Heme iron utilization protein n=2 Tax=Grimontia hollisae TaxID=673 RepID=A0A377JAB9_GRIHO|nr:heme utilization cystosolic carrier protein HutX [Grimontia hollisae]AMG29245.1 heme utilization cystosolic carrier protein HutX [Grimontia hollisae]EEY73141.1 putative heme iron utilization protein [Grimontia hollisae CIP 101886]MDF2185134.1 heme utilization cystosolic carrier protein HutX [Grimontia hollisae]STO76598.1 Putative heme iron utilization protein [Grimontia hollisae]STO98713.1 Putative heme iron utilization protein [Grimontia hollisae]
MQQAIIVTEETKQRVADYLAKDVHTPVSNMVSELGLTEGEITLALPESMVTRVEGVLAQTILEAIPSWGKVTTIVHSGGSVFEFKAAFPKGKVAHGYYNLMGREGQLHGHLRLDLVSDIVFVSKPFRGTESHYIGFYDASGHCVFKIYLGRDKKRQLFPEQVERFNAMKQELAK